MNYQPHDPLLGLRHIALPQDEEAGGLWSLIVQLGYSQEQLKKCQHVYMLSCLHVSPDSTNLKGFLVGIHTVRSVKELDPSLLPEWEGVQLSQWPA